VGRGQFWLARFRAGHGNFEKPDFSCDRTSFFISRMPKSRFSLVKDFFGVVGKMMVMSDVVGITSSDANCGRWVWLNELLESVLRPSSAPLIA